MYKFYSKLFPLFVGIFLSTNLYSQGTDCSTSDPFCTGTTYNFPNTTGAASLGTISCCTTTPNPAWYFMELDQSGDMTIHISQTNASGSGIDVDFVLFGPYSSLNVACASIPGGPIEDCSYSGNAQEDADIIGGVSGEVYILLLTNYANQSGSITFNQTGGAGSADCSILCGVQSFTAVPTACNPATNSYNLSGSLDITNPPASGTLTITNSCGGSQVFNAPFASPINYSFTSLTSNGNSCNVDAVFSADATCNTSASYTAPSSCTVACAVSSVTANVASLDCTNHTFDLTGTITFTNAPATGTLTVSSSCGSSQTFSAPFSSPQAYTFSGLPANGSSCTISAVFSADPGCTNSTSFTYPTAPIITASNSGPVCENGSLNLSVNTVNGATYSWSGPNGFSSGVQNLVISPVSINDAGVYTVTVNLGGCLVTSTTTVVVNPLPVATVGSGISVCEGDAINLNSTTVANASYNWSGPNGYSSNQQNPVINPSTQSNNGDYILTITVNGCTSLPETLSVVVNPLPVVTASSNSIICKGETLNLFATTLPGATYSWQGPDGFTSSSQNPIIVAADNSNAGTYSVTVTVNGCTSQASSTNVVVSQITAAFSASPQSGTPPLDVVFTNNTSGGAIYSWDYGNGNSENTSNTITNQQYADTGLYIVTMIAVNSDGCSDTASLIINVAPEYFIIIPNVFSPNSDNSNDVFELILNGAQSLQVDIYDRWGIFMHSYNSLNGSWDGKKDGKDVSEGTYYYIIQVTDALGEQHTYTGNITLIR